MKQTDETLAKLVEKGIEVAEKTGNFVIEQAPDLLKEFYLWHTTQSILGVVICLLTIAFSIIGIKKLNKYAKEQYYDSSDAEYFFPMIGIGFALLISFILFFKSAYELIFILVAPKLYLIEYFVK